MKPKQAAVELNQAESSSIKLNQGAIKVQSASIKLNRAESRPIKLNQDQPNCIRAQSS